MRRHFLPQGMSLSAAVNHDGAVEGRDFGDGEALTWFETTPRQIVEQQAAFRVDALDGAGLAGQNGR